MQRDITFQIITFFISLINRKISKRKIGGTLEMRAMHSWFFQFPVNSLFVYNSKS